MSILQIGNQSINFQASPGCRKYISPFLSTQEREQIQRLKQQNQSAYRQILMNQITQKQKQKELIKRKQIQEDLNHEKQFYLKFQIYRDRNNNSKSKKNRVSVPVPIINEQNAYTYHKKFRQEGHNELTLPPLQSSGIPRSLFDEQQLPIFKNEFGSDFNSLKSSTLQEIGQRLKRSKFERSLNWSGDRQNGGHELISRYQKKGEGKAQGRYEELKQQLKQKEMEVYSILEKCSRHTRSSKNPIKQLKRKLKTQQVYIPSDQQDDDPVYPPFRYRIKTQFGTRHFQDDQSRFYQLPSKDFNVLNPQQEYQTWITNQELAFKSRNKKDQSMAGIEEENPQNQFMLQIATKGQES